jgi:Ni/Fe-hydrogenase subunit HybB-like protein
MKRALEIVFWLICLAGGTLCAALVLWQVFATHQHKALYLAGVLILAVIYAATYLTRAIRGVSDVEQRPRA